MALFSGLGQALGAAAGGALRGQNLAEQENFRRGQIATQNERANNLYQLQLAKLSATQKDPDQKIRDAALRHADVLTRFRRDPQHALFYGQNPDVAKQIDDEIGLSYGVGTGTIDVSKWNPIRAQSIEAGLDTASGGGTGTAALESPGLGATGEQVRQHAFLAEHGGLAQPPPTALAPSNVGVVRKEAGLGPGPLAFQYPEPPAPASITNPASVAGQSPPSAAPAPAKPKLTQEGILAQIDALNKATPPEKLPLETPKAYETRVQHWQTNNHQQIVQLTQLLGAVPKAQAAAAAAPYAGPTAKAKLGLIGQQTRTGAAQETALKTLTPVREAVGRAQAKAIPERTRIAGAAQQATERLGLLNYHVNQARAQDVRTYHQALINRLNFLKDNADSLQLNQNQRALLGAAVRLYTANRGILDDPLLDPEDAGQLAEQIDTITSQMGGKGLGLGKGAGTAAPAPKPGPKTITPKAQARAGARGRILSGQEQSVTINGQTVTRSQFLERAKQHKLTGPQLQQALSRAGFR